MNKQNTTTIIIIKTIKKKIYICTYTYKYIRLHIINNKEEQAKNQQLN